jgi:RHS repeat-associated protein
MAELQQVAYTESFPGQLYMDGSGLYQNHHRTYDPVTGRYIESDPIGLGGGINTYTYGLDNPISNVDPLGLWVKRCSRTLGADTAAG